MKILVIGSINVDLTTVTNVMPKQGETVIGQNFQVLPGGKGANQAVAAARLGADVSFYGKVGDDQFAEYSLFNFKQCGIDTTNIEKVDAPTGIANIIVYENDNRIIINQGANAMFSIEDFDVDILDGFDIVLMQYEIDIDFTHYIIEQAHKKGKVVVLNPAPYNDKFNLELIDKIDYLIANQIEAESMFKKDYQKLLKTYPNKVLVTLGKDGVIYYDGKEMTQVIAEKVPVVDTTGAGDTFCGAFVASLASGMTLHQAVMKAVVAGTYSVQKLGAQSAMPWKGDI